MPLHNEENANVDEILKLHFFILLQLLVHLHHPLALTLILKVPRKTIENTPSPAVIDVMKELDQLRKKIEERDECDVFGEFIALRL